jgi:hypothetical protein
MLFTSIIVLQKFFITLTVKKQKNLTNPLFDSLDIKLIYNILNAFRTRFCQQMIALTNKNDCFTKQIKQSFSLYTI